MKKQGNSYVITFRMDEEDYDLFEKKFRNSKAKTKGQFIRRCIFNQYMLIPDKKLIEDTNNCLKLFRNITSNINQIAARANSTGAVYKEDTEEILQNIDTAKRECEVIWQELKYIQSQLHSLMP